jgi:hypothetical protein
MLEDIPAEYFDELPSDGDARPTSRRKTKQSSGAGYAPDQDIDLWLDLNAPRTFDQLADLRYCLYHKCSRGAFRVETGLDDDFTLFGRCTLVRIISNKARHFLLWPLRQIGWKNNWIGAIPRTKSSPSDDRD